VTEIRQSSEEWQWIFGKTPKFTISRKFTSEKHRTELSVIFHFEKGRIQSSEIICDSSVPHIMEFTVRLQNDLIGRRLHGEDLNPVLQVSDMSPLDSEHMAVKQWIVNCCVEALCTGV
jgi:hypothetical protein